MFKRNKSGKGVGNGKKTRRKEEKRKATSEEGTSEEFIALLWSTTTREAFRPIYVTEIIENFPEDLFLPYVSVRHEANTAKRSAPRETRHSVNECSSSVDIAEIFAWVYDDDVTTVLLQNAK